LSDFNPTAYPNLGLEGDRWFTNYCRNPDEENKETIWCYVTDERLNWEYCNTKTEDGWGKTNSNGECSATKGGAAVPDSDPSFISSTSMSVLADDSRLSQGVC